MRLPVTGRGPHRAPPVRYQGIFWPSGLATNAWSPRVYPIQSVSLRSQWVESVPIQAFGGLAETGVSTQGAAVAEPPVPRAPVASEARRTAIAMRTTTRQVCAY